MKTIWITYAWKDNEDQQVEFIAQQLKTANIDVAIDLWKIQSGRPLWEQISEQITNPRKSHGWIIYATPSSLASSACKEEFGFALNRALKSRGNQFPIIALFPGKYDSNLIPPSLQIRLNVSLEDSNWKERIHAAIEGREANVTSHNIVPFIYKVHQAPPEVEDSSFAIEIRPRLGSWSPFNFAIPLSEKERVSPYIMHGSKDQPPTATMLLAHGQGPSKDGSWWILGAQNPATPNESYYLYCKELPSIIYFGTPPWLEHSLSLLGNGN